MKKKTFFWKNSIRGQLAVVFILLLVAVVASIVLMNTAFLQRYYISNKKLKIANAYESIDKLLEISGAG